MKKCLCLLFSILFLCGCGKTDSENVYKEFSNNVNASKSYSIKASMDIMADEDTFSYSVDVIYLSKDYYKVTLKNKTNENTQVILKNKEGVYVVNPALNKSFKFQSEWPENSSQSYILKSIVDDLDKNEKIISSVTEENYILETNVNYPNNPELNYEKVYFDKSANLKKVEVYDEDDNLKIKVVFEEIDYKANKSENDFLLSDLLTNEECDSEESCKEEATGTFDNILYPLYMPENTYLSNSEKVTTDNGERVILTFAGDKSFVLVEEKAVPSTLSEIIPVYGEPVSLNDSVAALGANSLTWTSNNIDYYLTGSSLSNQELINVAKSINNTTTVSVEK